MECNPLDVGGIKYSEEIRIWRVHFDSVSQDYQYYAQAFGVSWEDAWKHMKKGHG